MSTEIRLRKGTATQHASFTGANAEVTVDTTNKALRVHDGSTPGGSKTLMESQTTAYTRTLLDDTTASAALTTLGVSTFAKTILDDADAATVRTTIGAQASLGFTPVQQGGGTGQGNNKVYVGWAGTGGINGQGVLKAQIDAVDLGGLWSSYNAVAPTSTTTGYFMLPNGLIVNYGQTTGVATTVFSKPFTTAVLFISATEINQPTATTELHSVNASALSLTQATWEPRYVSGSTVGVASQTYKWFAVGY